MSDTKALSVKEYRENIDNYKRDSEYSTNKAQDLWRHVKTVIEGVESYWKNKNYETPPEAYQSLIRLFCDTQGSSNDFFHDIVKLNHPPYKLPETVKGVLGELDSAKLKMISEQLAEDGFYVFEHKLDDDIIEELLEISRTQVAHVRPIEADAKTYKIEEELQEIYDPNNKKGIRYDYYPDVLLSNNRVQKMLADMSLIALAQEYLGCQPVSDVLGYWIHTDFVKESNAMAATKWHFDMDRIKWMKVFFYLSDMDTDHGPHCFVKGSHKTGGIPAELLKRGYARIEDWEVEQHYKKEDILEVVGKKGTIVAVDTRGLHKGKYLLKGDRTLFQMNFSDSLFGGAFDKKAHTFPEEICEELRDTMARYPRVFAKYNN